MAQTPTFSTESLIPLPDVFSNELTEIFNRSQPGIVQVYTEGRGGGTGFVWHKDGRIITNNHVVSRDDLKVQVLLSDGRRLSAKVLHRNPQLDLAVLKVSADNLQPLIVGKSSALRVGEWVFAIGHPWGQRWVVTAGIMSTISEVELEKDLTAQYIKSDVRLAPGNSGGPLLNADGEVVGINAMIFGGDLSVSIPSDTLMGWIANLPKGRATLGLLVQQVELPEEVQQASKTQQATGLLVVGMQSGRFAGSNDVLLGDILLGSGEQPIKNSADLGRILKEQREHETLALNVSRGGTILAVEAAIQTQELEQAA
jgi:serine protease Do